MIAIIGLAVGVIAGLLLQPTVPGWMLPYLPIAVVAALDAMVGGLRAVLEGVFDVRVFSISFISNIVIAAVLVYLGNQLGAPALGNAVVIVLGIRIFANAASIRRHLFKA